MNANPHASENIKEYKLLALFALFAATEAVAIELDVTFEVFAAALDVGVMVGIVPFEVMVEFADIVTLVKLPVMAFLVAVDVP